MRPRKHETDGEWSVYTVLRGLSRIVFRTYFRVRIRGLNHIPAQGGALIAANHQSFLDPIVGAIGFQRNCWFMARDTLFRNPAFGWLLKKVHTFPVRRGEADIAAVKELLRRLRSGQLVMVFPEGTRSRDGSLSIINPNSLAVAQRAGVPIIPATIDGGYRALPPGCFLPRCVPMDVTYSEAVTSDQVRSWPIERIAETVTQRIAEKLSQCRATRRGRHR